MVGLSPLKIALIKKKPIVYPFSILKTLISISEIQVNFKFKQFSNIFNIFYENTDETFIGINKLNIVKTFLQQVRNSYFLKAITTIR
jgi:hypothetical protein